MKYIIMCGGQYDKWKEPKQLTKIHGEPIVARTIRMLKNCGIEDIAISSNNPVFEEFGVPVLYHLNSFRVSKYNNCFGHWVNGFYPTTYPVCYLFGDVVYSLDAIKTIIDTPTDDIEFFASAPPFAEEYNKDWAEPFAFKVQDWQHFAECIVRTKMYNSRHCFKRTPIAWELWQVIKETPLNIIDYTNYTAINDYTCDIDIPEDVKDIERYAK